jgi:hypothetical protein
MLDPLEDETANDLVNFHLILNKIICYFLPIITVAEYIPLFDYAYHYIRNQNRPILKTVIVWIFVILNATILIHDIYLTSQTFSGYFLFWIIVRFILLPMMTFFHPLAVFLHPPKDTLLKANLLLSSFSRFFVIIAGFIATHSTTAYRDTIRIKNLAPPLSTYGSNIKNGTALYEASFYQINGISLIDAYGYALGPYDANRNLTIFETK